MANIKIQLKQIITDGMDITFKTPCGCEDITGINIYYIDDNTGKDTSKVFKLIDANGNNISNLENLFAEGVYIKAILDITNSKAFIQNADTNAYLEAKFETKAPMYSYGTTDLTPGTSSLTTGKLHFVYE